MQIKFDMKIIIFVLFFLIIGKLKLYILVLIYTIIHELAHTIVGILLGREISSFSIIPFGAYINFKIDITSYNKKIMKGTENNIKNIIIAIAGPVMNIIIGILFSLNKNYILITYINIILAIFNLLPIYPLDGGRVLKEWIVIVYGKRRALKYIDIISNISLLVIMMCIILFCYINKNILQLIPIIYLIYIRNKEHKICMIKERMYKILESISE